MMWQVSCGCCSSLNSSRKAGNVLLLAALAFCLLAVDDAAAHGSLLVPKARNWLTKLSNGPAWWDTSFTGRYIRNTYAYIYTLTEYCCMYNCNIVTKLADECINTQSAIYL